MWQWKADTLSRESWGKSLERRSNYWQLLPYLRPHWRTITQALLCTVVFTAFWPILAWIAGEMLSALVQGQVAALARLAGFTALGFLVQKLAQYGQDALMAKAALAIALFATAIAPFECS